MTTAVQPVNQTYSVLTMSTLFRGWALLTCPVLGCAHDRKFLETVHTKDDRASLLRRLIYLRLCHKAGRHQ